MIRMISITIMTDLLQKSGEDCKDCILKNVYSAPITRYTVI